ncbi:hypothetical protein HELRODRAFT_170803 [Helobdella robusta]|uniref:Uncharacterized protein n=1 Tax=Helobdella robusta TaxID=6412 RepID=T1F3G1_HELRO|nr:hypothetical protein HELRODRAFT_170803 [Helobdella robusta]ESO06785.1 hypothetical protein HELRODRAFT_170803 [Helobdella robusta]
MVEDCCWTILIECEKTMLIQMRQVSIKSHITRQVLSAVGCLPLRSMLYGSLDRGVSTFATETFSSYLLTIMPVYKSTAHLMDRTQKQFKTLFYALIMIYK